MPAAARLLRTRGYAGTSLRDILKKADAPWGSRQHYFPGGKAFTRDRGAEAAIRWFFFKAAEVVKERDFDAGCPVALVALEHAGDENEIARLSSRSATPATSCANWSPTRADERAGTLAVFRSMADRQATGGRRARTAKGEATRQRIIDAAADLMWGERPPRWRSRSTWRSST